MTYCNDGRIYLYLFSSACKYVYVQHIAVKQTYFITFTPATQWNVIPNIAPRNMKVHAEKYMICNS